MGKNQKNWKNWLTGIYKDNSSEQYLDNVANRIISLGRIKNNSTAADCGIGLGLIGFKILKAVKNTKVFGIDNNNDCLEHCRQIAINNGVQNKIKLINCSIERINLENESVDRIFTRSVLMHCKNKENVINEFYRLLKPKGQISLFEAVFYDKLDRIYEYLDPAKTKNYNFYKTVEETVRNELDDPLTNFDKETIVQYLKNAGFSNIYIKEINNYEFIKIKNKSYLERLFYSGLPHHISLEEKFLKYMTKEQFDEYYNEIGDLLQGKTVKSICKPMYITALKNPSFSDVISLFFKNLYLDLTYIIPTKIICTVLSLFKLTFCN